MKQNGIAPGYQQLLKCFTHLPQQILSLHGKENAAEYVLHSLCNEDCLNLSKAAYFIDNPDFNCLKGVAGFNKDEEVYDCDRALNDGEQCRVSNCSFNKKVRDILIPSARRAKEAQEQTVEALAHQLGLEHPLFHTWMIKHDNFGLLIFEREWEEQVGCQDFVKGISLLGFCPVS